MSRDDKGSGFWRGKAKSETGPPAHNLQWPAGDTDTKAPDDYSYRLEQQRGPRQPTDDKVISLNPAAPEQPSLDTEKPPSLTFPADRIYIPFETRSRPESLIILMAKLPMQAPIYPHYNFIFDTHYGLFLTLFYPFLTVNVTGQRLAEVAYAINSRKCAIIREWHRDFYDPAHRGVPLIQSITFNVPGEEL